MRIYRVDGKEQTELPTGIQIARDGKSTPHAPPNYPHKVEYIQTTDPTPAWILVCDHQRNFPQELAEALHGKLCHQNHDDRCAWHYDNWSGPSTSDVRQTYLAKAIAMLETILYACPKIQDEAAYNFAIRILNTL